MRDQLSTVTRLTIAIALFCGLCACQDTDQENPQPSSSESSQHEFKDAIDFVLTEMNGATFRLSDHKGKVVLLNFWATWCMPCREEIPDFIELQEEFKEEGLLLVGASLDEEGFDAVRPYAEEVGINYTMVIDEIGLAEQYGGHFAVPTSFLIDRKGKIRQRMIGIVDQKTLRPIVKSLLDEKG